MAGIQCEYTDGTVQCPNDAGQKCTGNWCHGGVYCVKHIQYLNSQYICDTCIREIERVRRELAEAAERRLVREAEAAAFVHAIYVAQEKSKIRYPRIMLLLSIILLVPTNIIAVSYPLLAYSYIGELIVSLVLALGYILLLIVCIWVIIIALQRGQKNLIILLVFATVLALPLYLIFNPVTPDSRIT